MPDMMTKIYVTRPYLPPYEEYAARLADIFARGILTNQGPEVSALEERLRSFLGVSYLHYVTNGTIALQLALKALNIDGGEVITTPFSYVATTSSLLWERCTPVFCDIETDNFTIDPEKIEGLITPNTKAVMPVHVFGYACDVEKIQKIAEKHHLKVIYDAAHAFGSVYKGKALASYGDASTLSFHATKLFHTVEGGAIIVKNEAEDKALNLIKRFGHLGDEHFRLGINGKQSEFHAAMGLAVFAHLQEILSERKQICETYDSLLKGKIRLPKKQKDLEYNYAYYPVIFESEKELLSAFARLEKIGVYPRRYFYPSLNELPYLKNTEVCPMSEDISKRIACLPLFVGLHDNDISRICGEIV